MRRKLRYRLRRIGAWELEAWLMRLDRPEVWADAKALAAVERLMAAEVDELWAMMRGERPLPEALACWLR
ncbi:MAG: succinate dehydrogenase assembly factor 2 [Zetaproteobacteria bacterium]|nr:MAG: succinate dehydrogenase assembly factor 2 [Zetaproteobacteria bacterium]